MPGKKEPKKENKREKKAAEKEKAKKTKKSESAPKSKLSHQHYHVRGLHLVIPIFKNVVKVNQIFSSS